MTRKSDRIIDLSTATLGQREAIEAILRGEDPPTTPRPTNRNGTHLGPVPRGGSTGRPITFKGTDEERAAYEDQAAREGFRKASGEPNLSEWIRATLDARVGFKPAK